MSRLTTIDPTEATGLAAETFASIKRAAGMIPNAYLTIGTHNPEGLDAMLRLDEVVAYSGISDADLEAIRLIVSEWAGCHYSVTAHSLKAKFSGLSREAISNIREGNSTGDSRRDVLLEFVRNIMFCKGTISLSLVESIIRAGYSEHQIIGISLAIASTMFTSTVNRVNDTIIDYPEI
ncbi:carboxymuconolactone decarboxylase family protein [Pseudomonas sp.]|uniref:carboxymuconolactone decarboxylase family protein n=1 Tax=Pseudomonas sp. TaxID=306 RepID=UPI003A97B8DC